MAVTPNNLDERELFEQAKEWLRTKLPKNWSVESRPAIQDGRAVVDEIVEIRSPGIFATLAIEVRSTFAPRDVSRLLRGVGGTLRSLTPYVGILVVAPWLSPRTRELLREENFNYLDLTGNARIVLDQPAVFIESVGANRDPYRTPRARSRLRGPKAYRLIRLLLDVKPPYGVRDVAAAAGLNPGYVSQILASLDEEALIDRSPRGEVLNVNVEALIERWSRSYDVLESNRAISLLIPSGPQAAFRAAVGADRVVVTGSFAASRIAAVAEPAIFMAYADDESFVRDLNPIRTDRGANVVVLRPFDPVVFDRTTSPAVSEPTYAAAAQVAVDCLTGPGRMPAEAQALMSWMMQNPMLWRLPTLPESVS
ncbi:MAG TPA: hypothetical protein VFB25_00555 [Gaiellaceae bacterium]|nr:hypothetical protein [Gaiellaceae bacterium]